MSTTSDSKRDLAHFLNLALLQVQSRIKKEGAPNVYNKKVETLKMLEELIKEQVPNESSRSSAR